MQKVDVKYPGYSGHRLWCGYHPDCGSCVVSAPNYDAALMAVSAVFGVDWRDFNFGVDLTISLVG